MSHSCKERKCFVSGTAPERSWAAKTWSQRATAWLHTEPHDLELEDAGKTIIHHINGYENGLKVTCRTLSQMEIVPFRPTIVSQRVQQLSQAGRELDVIFEQSPSQKFPARVGEVTMFPDTLQSSERGTLIRKETYDTYALYQDSLGMLYAVPDYAIQPVPAGMESL